MERWEVLSERSLLKVNPWLEVLREQVRLPAGTVVDDFYAVRMPSYSSVVALTADERVVIERHYKHAPRAVVYGLPGGYLAEGEVPLAGAQRELLEETGYAAKSWASLGTFVVDGNRGCGAAHLFLARDAARAEDPASGDLEEIEVELVTFEEILPAVRSDPATELSTVTGLGLAYLEMRCHGK